MKMARADDMHYLSEHVLEKRIELRLPSRRIATSLRRDEVSGTNDWPVDRRASTPPLIRGRRVRLMTFLSREDWII